MTRAGSALLTLVGGACLALGCGGASPRDINFNTDAGSDFEPPLREAGSDTDDAEDVGAAAGAAGATGGTGGGAAGAAAGAGGAAGGAAGAAGNGVSDGGTA